MVVVESPAINHPACFLEAQEDFTVEQLVAKRAIERFDIPVLPRAALGDEQCFDISLFQPTADYLGHELWAVVTANVFGRAAYGEQVLLLQHTHHILSGKRTAHFDRQTFSRVLVNHHQQPKLTTVLGPICHKVV